MLANAGIPVEAVPADIDERAIEAAARPRNPRAAAALLAKTKAEAIAKRLPGRVVLGADQVLALGSKRFSKPVDRDGARAQLSELRGKAHELHSAVALLRDGEVIFEFVGVARLAMRTFSEAFLDSYLEAAGASVTQSVGGYQLENFGAHLFERIEGDHFSILGLPLLPLLGSMRNAGLLAR